MNTFNDIADVAATLRRPIVMEGASAGGLAAAATALLNPLLFDKVVCRVPFVDVLTTMQDDTIPLTEQEYVEWGHPDTDGDYMALYSPTDNVQMTASRFLLTTGMADARVHNREAFKFYKLLKRAGVDALLRVRKSSGHFGSADRFVKLRERAEEVAFIVS